MIEIIRNLNDFGELADEWNLLPGARQNPLLRHEWFLSSAESFYKENNLCVNIVRENGRLRAAAPLVLVKRHGLHRLELLGASFLHEPTDVLYDGEDSLSELYGNITRLSHATVLQRVTGSSSLTDQITKQSQGRGKLIKLSATSAPYIELTPTWEHYISTLSSRRRYDLRRARSKLEQAGEVSVEFICPSGAELEHYLQDAIRIESSGWKGRAGSALIFNGPLLQFMRAYTQRTAQLGTLQLCYLKSNNEAIAMQIGIQYAERYWVLKIGYDERWAFCSPGMQLTMEAVKYAFSKGFKTYEFLGADESWLRMWTQSSRPCSTLIYYPYSVQGLSALGTDAVNSLRKRSVRLLSRSVRNLSADNGQKVS